MGALQDVTGLHRICSYPMSISLLSSKSQIDSWLNMQLQDRPIPVTSPNYPPLIGGNRPFGSIKKLLDTVINRSAWDWSLESSLDDLGCYFKLPANWWKDRVGMGALILNAVAAAFADAWIYYQWLRENRPELGDTYMEFFACSVMHPEWIKALDQLEVKITSNQTNTEQLMQAALKEVFTASA